MRRLFGVLVCLLIMQAEVSADRVILKSGKELNGTVLEETEDRIKIDYGVGMPLTYFKDQVAEIIRDESSAAAAPDVSRASGKSLCWQVTSKTATVYLCGSIHLGKPDMYPMNDNVEKAFEAAPNLVLEIHLDDAKTPYAQKLFATKGRYPPGETIRDHITTDVLSMLQEQLRNYRIPYQGVESLKPWMMTFVLMDAQMQALGLNKELGVDIYFFNRAKAAGKRIKGLETLAMQINLLDSIGDQNDLLKYYLLEFEETPEIIDFIISAWKTGDDAALAKKLITESLEEDPEILPIFEKMFFERNRNMAAQIRNFLKGPNVYFVVIGAGHLVGEEGIVEILRSHGYEIEQM